MLEDGEWKTRRAQSSITVRRAWEIEFETGTAFDLYEDEGYMEFMLDELESGDWSKPSRIKLTFKRIDPKITHLLLRSGETLGDFGYVGIASGSIEENEACCPDITSDSQRKPSF